MCQTSVSRRKRLSWKNFFSHKNASELTFQIARFNFHLASFLKIVPFQLRNNGKLNVEHYDKQWKVGMWYAVNVLVLLSSVYQIGSFIQCVWSSGFTSETAIRLFYFFLAMMPILFLTPMLLMPNKAVFVINQLGFLTEISKSNLLSRFKKLYISSF